MQNDNNDAVALIERNKRKPALPRTFASPWTALYLCLIHHRGMRPKRRAPVKGGRE